MKKVRTIVTTLATTAALATTAFAAENVCSKHFLEESNLHTPTINRYVIEAIDGEIVNWYEIDTDKKIMGDFEIVLDDLTLEFRDGILVNHYVRTF